MRDAVAARVELFNCVRLFRRLAADETRRAYRLLAFFAGVSGSAIILAT